MTLSENIKNNSIWIGLGVIVLLIFLLSSGFNLDFDDLNPGRRVINGTGDPVKKEIVLDEVNSIVMEIRAELILTQDDDQKTVVEAQANIQEVINLQVVNGQLIISSDFNFGSVTPVKIYLNVKDLNHIWLKGKGKVSSTNMLVSKQLDVRISGSGELNMDLNTDSLSTRISGSGDINYRGRAKNHMITISGSGDAALKQLKTLTSDVSISGSADVFLYAKDSLSVKISGSGDVTYYGDPVVNSRVSGSGSINKKRY